MLDLAIVDARRHAVALGRAVDEVDAVAIVETRGPGGTAFLLGARAAGRVGVHHFASAILGGLRVRAVRERLVGRDGRSHLDAAPESVVGAIERDGDAAVAEGELRPRAGLHAAFVDGATRRAARGARAA